MRFIINVLLALSLCGCGAAYISPAVLAGATAGGVVTVTAIDATSIANANSSAYRPKTLPAIFTTTTDGALDTQRLDALPAATVPPEVRPDRITTHLPPTSPQGPYRIGVGDVVLIASPQAGSSVEALTGLLATQNRRQGYAVQDDGAIAVPDVGRIVLGGLTITQAEEEVFRRLLDSQINPVFSLEIAEFNSQRVTIGGAVRNATVVPVTLTPLLLAEALSVAGGIAASEPGFTTIRIYRDGTIYQVPLHRYLDDASVQKIPLQGGDSIYVDTAFDLTKAQAYFEQQIRLVELRQTSRAAALGRLNAEVALRRSEMDEARANYQTLLTLDALERDYVYLVGEVGVQGRYTLPFGRTASLADALFDGAGGVPVKTGNIAEVYVLRAIASGSGIVAWRLDARNAANLVLATQFELRPNDIIFAAEQPITKWNRVMQQLVPSLVISTVNAAAN